MKVALIQARVDVGDTFSCYPLPVLYVASSINEKDEVKVIDQNFQAEEMSKITKKFSPDVIGVSFSTGSKSHAFNLAREFKGQNMMLIAGGVHATARPEECLRAGFDYVIRGEAEEAFPALLNSIRKREKPNIKGVAFSENNRTVNNGVTNTIRDLNSLKFPAREMIDKRVRDSYKLSMIIGSRGCKYHCIFCNSCNSIYRQRGVENFMAELEYCLDNFPQRIYHFPDDGFTYNPAWTKSVCKAIKEKNLDFEWSANSRADLKDASLFKDMKDANCQVLSFGIESGSQKILDTVNKGIRIKDAEYVVAKAMKYLKVRTEWIVALPGTFNEQIKSVSLMKRMKTDQVMVNLNIPYPGSPEGDCPERFGIHMLSENWSEIISNIYVKGSFWNAIRYDYLTKEQILHINDMILKTMLPIGYKYPEEAGKDDKIIKTFAQKSVLQMTRK